MSQLRRLLFFYYHNYYHNWLNYSYSYISYTYFAIRVYLSYYYVLQLLFRSVITYGITISLIKCLLRFSVPQKMKPKKHEKLSENTNSHVIFVHVPMMLCDRHCVYAQILKMNNWNRPAAKTE